MRTQRLKYLVDINRESLAEDTDPEREYHYLDIGAVGRGFLVDAPIRTTFGDAPSRARRIVREGDTIISTVRTYLRAVWPVRSPLEDLVVSTGFAVLSPGPSIDARYLAWLAQSDVVIESVVSRSVGVSYPAINASAIGDISVPMPPMATQRAIADFLDAETARIDTLIEKKRGLIVLEVERLESLIVKSTQLPEGVSNDWIRCKLKHVARVERGRFNHRPRNDPDFYDGPYPFVQTGDIRSAERYLTEASQSLSDRGKEVSRSFPAGTTLMGIAANVGDVAITTFESWCPDSVVGFTPGQQISSSYLYFLLLGLRERINETSTENTQENTNIERLGTLEILLPPQETQTALEKNLTAASDAGNDLIRILLAQIDLLNERRQALITATVTGEFNVAGVAA